MIGRLTRALTPYPSSLEDHLLYSGSSEKMYEKLPKIHGGLSVFFFFRESLEVKKQESLLFNWLKWCPTQLTETLWSFNEEWEEKSVEKNR